MVLSDGTCAANDHVFADLFGQGEHDVFTLVPRDLWYTLLHVVSSCLLNLWHSDALLLRLGPASHFGHLERLLAAFLLGLWKLQGHFPHLLGGFGLVVTGVLLNLFALGAVVMLFLVTTVDTYKGDTLQLFRHRFLYLEFLNPKFLSFYKKSLEFEVMGP